MDCICTELNVILYIEKELPETEMLQMEQHFAHCAHCRHLLAQHRMVRLTLERASGIQVPADFSARVMAGLPSPYHRFLTTAREKIIAAAAAIVMVSLGVFTYLIGSLGQNFGSPLSLQWWNRVLVQTFTLAVDTFIVISDLVGILVSVALFLGQGLAFVMETLGRLLLYSPHGLATLCLSLAIFLASLSLTKRYGHARTLRTAQPGRQQR